MKKRLQLILVSSCLSALAFSQNLQTFTLTLQPGKQAYLSLKNKKAYSAAEAVAVKDALDLVLTSTLADKQETLEWYNLKKDNEKVPAGLWGTATAVVAISFDRDQFDKCKTVADLRRMTGYMTRNSFSHFAVIKNSDNSYQHCFITENAEGKRALIYVTLGTLNELKTEIKAE